MADAEYRFPITHYLTYREYSQILGVCKRPILIYSLHTQKDIHVDTKRQVRSLCIYCRYWLPATGYLVVHMFIIFPILG